LGTSDDSLQQPIGLNSISNEPNSESGSSQVSRRGIVGQTQLDAGTSFRKKRFPTYTQGTSSLSIPVFMFVAFLVVAAWCDVHNVPSFDVYPVLFFGPIIFLIVQFVSTTSRLRLDTPLCPSNWGWLLFAYQLVVQPALLIYYGPSSGQLLTLPSQSSIQEAFLLECLAYVAYTVGLTLTLRRPRLQRSIGNSWDEISPTVLVSFLVLCVAALIWQFHTIPQLITYFKGGFTHPKAGSATSSSLSSAASLFLKPLGAYGLIMLWARSATSANPHKVRFFLLGFLALAIFATYDYNRASVLVPLVALAAAYGRHIRKLPLRNVVILGLIFLTVWYAFGNYRRIELATVGGEVTAQSVGINSTPSLQSQLQIYGGAPQFSAVVLENISNLGGYSYGRALFDDAIDTVPKIGKPFRAQSGVVQYNQLVYGRPGVADQILPFLAESYWNFGLFGVFFGYLALGMGIATFQRRFDVSGSLIAAFICQYFGMWIAYLIIGGVESVAQVFIYFSLPIIAIALAPTRESSLGLKSNQRIQETLERPQVS
jgi:hypothetical protein